MEDDGDGLSNASLETPPVQVTTLLGVEENNDDIEQQETDAEEQAIRNVLQRAGIIDDRFPVALSTLLAGGSMELALDMVCAEEPFQSVMTAEELRPLVAQVREEMERIAAGQQSDGGSEEDTDTPDPTKKKRDTEEGAATPDAQMEDDGNELSNASLETPPVQVTTLLGMEENNDDIEQQETDAEEPDTFAAIRAAYWAKGRQKFEELVQRWNQEYK